MKADKRNNKLTKNTVLAVKRKVQIQNNKIKSNLKMRLSEHHLFLFITLLKINVTNIKKNYEHQN